MRLKDKEITQQNEMDEIMEKAQVCRLAVSYHDMPYIIPMNFGYSNQVLYFHSAGEGLKLSILRENPQASFEVDINTEIVPSEHGCDWSMRYQSVVGFGEVEFIEGIEAKREGMTIIMQHYSDKVSVFKDSQLAGVTLFKLKINTMTGKKSG
ncbi:pyridoxamine 5'-phosphate oxidase family protein [Desulfosporosinus sp. BICA1-9]|uniref:pyridoxamine 5'-phosphate oxidase family protein n=1 Tax=Desulfosporosinus sp. BICA1-9 TaxID=1531958 RepID=UPI00054B559F|nr:pyridoxamine 5'-phosphate oxidase family protein [Desulfosporosinus sp. BICA1-9]KJS49753.1 MAG: pyridoxamine 5'-phosphate oxidase [Peptococcaceae bacterium BRH_c23]KJS90193.1 MAG: pyridoxamine 5'-phosphate oxidase [Desulfosporosinus sp. BICA1-9]HBW38785.1 pyridoxamine 5'-phosphate oxidase family protein [Desulfosporosinus sp.]